MSENLIERRTRDILSELNQVGAAISRSAEVEEIFQRTCEAAVRLFGVEHAGVALFKDNYAYGQVEAEFAGPGGEAFRALGITFQVRGIAVEEDVALRGLTREIPDVTAEVDLAETLRGPWEAGLRSMLLVPMISSGRSVGSLGLDALHRQRRFSEREKELAQVLANQAATAYESAHWAWQLEGLAAKMAWVNQADGRADLLTRACQAVVELTGADHSGLAVFDPDRQWATVQAEYPAQVGTEGERIRLWGIAPEEALAEAEVPLVEENVVAATELGEVRGLLMRYDIQSIAVVPVRAHGRVAASFSVDAIGRRWRFTNREVELCQIFAAQLGASLERFHLEDWRERIALATETVQQARDPERVVDLLIDKVLQALPGAERGAIHLYDPDTDRLRLQFKRADVGASARRLKELRPGHGIAGWVFANGEGVVVADASQDPRYVPSVSGMPLHRSMVCVPMGNPEQPLGTITVASVTAPNLFNESDRRLLEQLAGLAVAALDSAETRVGQDYARSLLNIIRPVNSADGPRQVLETAVHALRLAAQAQQVIVVGFEGHGGLKLLAHVGIEHPLGEQPVRADGYSAEVYRTGQARFFPDTSLPLARPLNPGIRLDAIGRAACLPIRPDGQTPLGVLWVQFREVASFSPTERDLLQVFADYLAGSYVRARRLERQQRQQEVIRQISEPPNPAGVRLKIVAGARHLLGADAVVLWAYDEQRQRFMRAHLAAAGVPAEVRAQLEERPKGSGRTTRLIAERGYLVGNWAGALNELPPDDWPGELGPWTRKMLRHLGARAYQAVLLPAGDRGEGALLACFRQPRAFTAEDEAELRHFAEDAARALARARLQARLERQRQATASIVRASTEMRSLDDTLQALVEGAMMAVGCDGVTICVYDDRRRRFTHTQTAGRGPALPPVGSASPGPALELGLSLAPGGHVFSDNPAGDERLAEAFARAAGIQAVLALPLYDHEQRLGLMFFNYLEPRVLGESDKEDARELASYAVPIIRDAQHQADAQRKTHALAALTGGEPTFDLQTTLNRITDAALQLVEACAEAQGCFSNLALLEGRRLRFAAASPRPVLARLQHQLPFIYLDDRRQSPRVGVSGRAALTGQAQNAPDLSLDADYILFEPSTRSQAAVLVRDQGRVLGVLNVESAVENAFGPEHIDWLQALADQAAVHLRAVRAFERAELAARISRQASRLEWDEFVTNLFTELRRHWQARGEIEARPSLAEYELARDRLKVHHRRDFYPEPGGPDYLDREAAGIVPFTAWHAPEPVYHAPDVLADPHYERVWPGARSECAVRIEYDGQLLGVLDIETDQPQAFTPDDLKLLETLRDHIAVALHNVQHHRAQLARHTSLAWSGLAASRWGYGLTGKASNILDLADLLATDLRAEARPEVLAEYVDLIRGEAQALLGWRMTQPDEPAAVRVNELVAERVEQLQPNRNYRKVSLETDLRLDDQAAVRASPEYLRSALDILVENAARAQGGGQPRVVRVSTRAEGDKAVIEVRDNAGGIPKEVRARLLDEQIAKRPNEPGHGTGLLMARFIVEEYCGELVLGESDATGTSMMIRLPLDAPAHIAPRLPGL